MDIKIGFIGLGCRGEMLLKDTVLPQGEEVVAVCDAYRDRAEKCADIVFEKQGVKPAIYTDYHDVLNDDNVNTVIIATAWESHADIAIAAMKAGKAVGLEVGGACSIEQCYELVNTYEETKTPFMFLENCCFGRRELMVLNMAKQGVFGEIVHCSGGYHHDLRWEIGFGEENRHYRLKNYLARNCENYPTHELGPIARILNINRGNRMLTLSSTASKASGMREFLSKEKSWDENLRSKQFAQGDIVTTVIKCANGETIVLTLDTTLPRFYSRGFTVRGTNGMYEEATDSVFIDSADHRKHDFDWRKSCGGNATEYEEQYEHPIWQKFLSEGVQGTHDGMDWLEFEAFFDALKNGKPMPIDIYDATSWMVVTALSEMSIAKGGCVMDVPDFTKGQWINRRE